MAKYRSKPCECEAFQWFPNMGLQGGVRIDHDTNSYYVVTISGDTALVDAGDFIITEPDGIHHYPCKPAVFERRWELAP